MALIIDTFVSNSFYFLFTDAITLFQMEQNSFVDLSLVLFNFYVPVLAQSIFLPHTILSSLDSLPVNCAFFCCESGWDQLHTKCHTFTRLTQFLQYVTLDFTLCLSWISICRPTAVPVNQLLNVARNLLGLWVKVSLPVIIFNFYFFFNSFAR